jgi:hypothetical protein
MTRDYQAELDRQKEQNDRIELLMALLHDEPLSSDQRQRIAELAGLVYKGKGRLAKGADTSKLLMTSDFKTPERRKRLAELLIGRPIWCEPADKEPGRPPGARHFERLDFAMHYHGFKEQGANQDDALNRTMEAVGKFVTLESAKRLVQQGRKEPYVSEEDKRKMVENFIKACLRKYPERPR